MAPDHSILAVYQVVTVAVDKNFLCAQQVQKRFQADGEKCNLSPRHGKIVSMSHPTLLRSKQESENFILPLVKKESDKNVQITLPSYLWTKWIDWNTTSTDGSEFLEKSFIWTNEQVVLGW